MTSTSLDSTVIRRVADETGRRTATTVPIKVWEETESEMETRCRLNGPAIRRRLLQAPGRTDA